MNQSHQILPEHKLKLIALQHPDTSARVQTLQSEDDEFLFQTIQHFGNYSNFPIIVNTSFNGPDEPIVETPDQALRFFLYNDYVDYLLLNDELISKKEPEAGSFILDPAIVTTSRLIEGSPVILFYKEGMFIEISSSTYNFLCENEVVSILPGMFTEFKELKELIFKQFLKSY